MTKVFKRLTALVLSGIMVAGLVACGNSGEVSNNEEFRLVKMNSYEGYVSLERDGNETDIFAGIQLQTKDSVTTGNNSLCELLVDSDKHIIASANTNFSINASGDENSGKVTLNVSYGETLIAIDNKLNENSEFVIETPNASLSVRGTVFNVYCDETGKTAVIVTEGTVWISNEDGSEETVIEAGSGAVITEDEITTGTTDEIVEEVPEVAIDEESEKLLMAAREDADNGGDAGDETMDRNDEASAGDDLGDEVTSDSDLSLASVGDVVSFGTYLGSPIEWDVLDIEDDKVLLISHTTLGYHVYDQEGVAADSVEDTNWEQSDIRAYLNDELYNEIFTLDEQSLIITSTISNPSSEGCYLKYYPENYWFAENTNPCGDTQDKLFLLSWEELDKYYTITVEYSDIEGHDMPFVHDAGVDCHWGLRSAGIMGTCLMEVESDGRIGNGNGVIGVTNIRPAMWVTR